MSRIVDTRRSLHMREASEKERAAIPPPGAAVSGVVFSVLTAIGLGLVRYAIPTNLRTPGVWLEEPSHRAAVQWALELVPFACIAFLWFIGVLRDRLGKSEDQFFATVFFGSGLLFVACTFGSAAITSALVQSIAQGGITSETYFFGRSISDSLLNLFAMKMAGVFIFSICTIALRTALFPRWLAYAGYACGLVMLVVIANWRWITLLFPAWMLLLSVYILSVGIRLRSHSGNPAA